MVVRGWDIEVLWREGMGFREGAALSPEGGEAVFHSRITKLSGRAPFSFGAQKTFTTYDLRGCPRILSWRAILLLWGISM